MARLIEQRRTTYPALAVPTYAARVSRFAAALAAAIINREDTTTTLTQSLLTDLATSSIPSEALTNLNEAFCKELITLLSGSIDEQMRLRLVRQVTHAQISVRMTITNAHLQNILAQRRHE